MFKKPTLLVLVGLLCLFSLKEINAQPPTPILGWPTGGTTVYTLKPYANWYHSTFVPGLTYNIQVATDVGFTSIVFWKNDIPYTNVELTNLLPGTTYYWRVRSKTIGGTYSSYSTTGSFVTDGTPGGNPIVNINSFYASGLYVTVPVYLDLNGSGGARGYMGKVHFNPTKLGFVSAGDGVGTLLFRYRFNQLVTDVDSADADNATLTFAAVAPDSVRESGLFFNITFLVRGTPDTTLITPHTWTGFSPSYSTFSYNAGTLTYLSNGTGGGALRGDANLDGFVNLSDAVLVSQEVTLSPAGTTSGLGFVITDAQARSNADANVSGGDGYINTSDVQAIMYYAVNGTWPPQPNAPGFAGLTFGNVSYDNWNRAYIPLILNNANNLNSTEIIFEFDPSKINYQNFATQLLSSGYFVHASQMGSGKAKFVVAAVNSMSGTFHAGEIILTTVGTGTITTQIKANNGQFQNGPSFTFGVTDAGETTLPKEFSVKQNYPNPFNPSTRISYSLPENGFVSVKVYDMLGNEVTTLLSEEKTAGNYNLEWNGTDNLGNSIVSGTYILRVVQGLNSQSIKMLFLK